MTFTLHTPASYLNLFTNRNDRTYWSEPREVEPLYSTLVDRLTWVRESRRGVFPVNPDNLRVQRAQRRAA